MSKHSQETGKAVLEAYDWSVFAEDAFVQPVLATKDGVVIDGAHRTVAARELGLSIPVIVIDAEVTEMDPNDLTTWLDFQTSARGG